MIEIPAWLTTFFTGVLAAFFGYFVAVKKFKKERLWQEKYKSYQEILNALEMMLLWATETYCENKLLPTISAQTRLNFNEARRVVSKQTCIGSLLISNEVMLLLHKIEEELWSEDFRAEDEANYGEEQSEYMAQYAENIRHIIDSRLERIVYLAKKDLN